MDTTILVFNEKKVLHKGKTYRKLIDLYGTNPRSDSVTHKYIVLIL